MFYRTQSYRRKDFDRYSYLCQGSNFGVDVWGCRKSAKSTFCMHDNVPSEVSAPVSMSRIAKLAGVSSATVSRVVNGSSLVNAETAARVREVLDKFGFVPDGNATTLTRGKSDILGLILPDLTNPFFTDLLDSFEAITSSKDQDLLTANTRFSPQRVEACIRRMLMRRVDGIALVASEVETGPFESLMRYRVPLVTLDRGRAGEWVSDVSIDFDSALEDAVRHLKQLGHRRIAFIGGVAGLNTSTTRKQAFIKALSKNGLRLSEEYLQEGNYRAEGGAAAMSRILMLRRLPSAVVTANDFTAVGALQRLNELGISVPNQMSIIGFDDISICSLVHPQLTTLRICRDSLAQLMYKALDGGRTSPENRGRHYKLTAELVMRHSVADLR